MSTASLARCPSCHAIVNAHWVACLACRGRLEPELQERSASPSSSNWLGQWQRLARVAGLLSEEDPHYDPMLAALGACHNAYKTQNREQFAKHVEEAMRLAAFVPGSMIRWRGHDKRLQGPATVNEVIYEDGRLWACVKWAGQLYWVSELIVDSIFKEGEK